VEMLQPDVVYFVKYEFWYHHLYALKNRNIPTYCVSAVFRENQVFFKWYGAFFRNILKCFSQIFVQDDTSKKLLQNIDIQSIVTGDTRIDRVQDHAKSVKPIPLIAEFLVQKKAFIAGSTWPKDEALLASLFDDFPKGYKLIIAPHEIDEPHIQNIVKLFNINVLRYSNIDKNTIFNHFNVLIIDNIGMLSSLYQYGEMAYIGGGFGKGIHNTLEPLAFGLPVIIGPNFHKFTEAVELSKPNQRAIFSVQNESELRHTFAALQQSEFRNAASKIALDFINQNSGATDRILDATQK
jgi:3-deoxy-D-manno-octulosonic-acid transferase